MKECSQFAPLVETEQAASSFESPLFATFDLPLRTNDGCVDRAAEKSDGRFDQSGNVAYIQLSRVARMQPEQRAARMYNRCDGTHPRTAARLKRVSGATGMRSLFRRLVRGGIA